MSAIRLARSVEAIQIPSGQRKELPAGTEVSVTQALGNTYTVIVLEESALYRILGDDADALGLESKAAPKSEGEGRALSEDAVWDQLKTCYDPEIPVNIVDLGLVYHLDLHQQEGGAVVDVKMTLTAPHCGMGPSIAADARQKILLLPGVKAASVDLVWEPPWSPDRISAEGRVRLGMV
jgi:probable FeS assembly SUF system protein SufT